MAEHHDDVQFEPKDVRITGIVVFLVALSICIVIAMGGLWLMQRHYVQVEQAKKPEHPLAVARAATPEDQRWPPEPRIEGIGGIKASHSITNAELPTSAKSQREREEHKLANGWTDAAGKKHPPIMEAMKQIAAKNAKGKAP